MEFISCIRCGGDMPKLRLDLYGYKYCVQCSTEKPKVARNVTLGTGDHTYNEIEIMDSDTAESIQRQEEYYSSYGKKRKRKA